ncbi:unnamed protein product [Brugia timori]|uniref:DUF4413 domain-containing protein n=1 Tax=Brugia timori TaxID=42155 RepID=A0A0R3QZI9_9BILA|nr:unnamed protein product [Brugia timori]
MVYLSLYTTFPRPMTLVARLSPVYNICENAERKAREYFGKSKRMCSGWEKYVDSISGLLNTNS